MCIYNATNHTILKSVTDKFDYVSFLSGSQSFRILGRLGGLYNYPVINSTTSPDIISPLGAGSNNPQLGFSFVKNSPGFINLVPGYGYAAINDGNIYKTTNGGYNWTLELTGIPHVTTDYLRFKLTNFKNIIYYGGDQCQIFIRRISENIMTKFDNISRNGTMAIDGASYNTDALSPGINLWGGTMNFVASSIQTNSALNSEALFYKWDDNTFNTTKTSYFDTEGNNVSSLYKTKNISTDNTAITKAASTKTLKNVYGYIDRIHNSVGHIFFSRSTDNGATFSREEFVSNRTDPNTNNINPFIAEVKTNLVSGVDAGNNSAVVWEQRDGNNVNVIYAQRFPPIGGGTGTWSIEPSTSGGISFSINATGFPDFHCDPKLSVIKTSSTSNAYFTVISYINTDGKLMAKVNSNGGATNMDLTITGGTVSDFAIISKQITSGGNGHSIDYAFLRNNNIYYKHINFYVYSPSFAADSTAQFNVSNGDGNTLRYSPDISLKKGKAIITYQASGSITKAYSTGDLNEEPQLLTLQMYPVIVRFRLNGSDPTNASNWSSWIKQPSSGSTVQSQPNIEGSASPNTNVESYILNYKKGDNIYAQFTSLPGYRTDPPYYLGTDSKLIKGSYINPTDGALLTTLSPPVSSVYTLGKQSVGIIPNSISVADGVYNNISGVVEMNSTQYIFDLGPIIIASGSALLETPLFGAEINEADPHTCVEFNEYMKSDVFSIQDGDTLILGTTAGYVDNASVHYYPMKYTVNLVDAISDNVVKEIFSDTIRTSLEETVQYYRGFVMDGLESERGPFYLKMEVEDVSGNDSKYEYIGAYSPDEETAEAFAGGYRSKTHGMYVDFGRGLHPSNNTITTAPTEYKLAQNFPNPFNPTTTIKYSLPKDGLAQIKIYDIAGKEVMTLVNEVKVAGNYEVRFNGANLSSGIYFYRINAGDFVQTKRMVLVK